MKKRIFIKKSRGFTLIEILLAIFVFGLVISVVFGAYTGTLNNVNAVEKTMTGYESGKVGLERIHEDLSSLQVTPKLFYKKPSNEEEHDSYRILTDTSDAGGESFPRLRFASMGHVDLSGEGRTGVAEIVYYVTKDPTDENSFVLRRADTLDFDLLKSKDERADPILCDRIRSVTYTFYDEQGDEHEDWDSDSSSNGFATPAAVAVRIEMDGPDGREGTAIRFETRAALPVVREKLE